ncbi:DNA-processing protein DprA [Corynebacterium sp. S7]
MTSDAAWAYLNTVFDGPSPALQQALEAGRSAEEIAHGIQTRASWLGPLAQETERRRDINVHETIEQAGRAGFELIHPESRFWPGEVIDEAFYHAKEFADVSSRTDPRELTRPHGLWIRGNLDLKALTARAVGIVGTRAATQYGVEVTQQICTDLARHHYTIFSGGALGIDTHAHTTALECGTPTVAVMASGPGFVYPLRNKDLFNRIVERGGALITEYAPGTPAERFRFLVRNRLVAALTQGTVVVEAPYRSGALNTMKRVDDFGRLPMAVPGPINGGASNGSNNLIKQQRAVAIVDIREVHAHLARIGEVDVDAQLELEYAPSPIQELSRNELRVYDVLPREDQGGITAEEAATKAGLGVALTVHLLVELAKRAIVVRQGTKWAKLPGPQPGIEQG